MTTFNLRHLRLRSGEQFRETLDVQLEPVVLGGSQYLPVPAEVPAELTVTKATTGSVYQLSFRARLHGPCFRCLRDSVLDQAVDAREYEATSPGDDEELRSPYITDDTLDLSAWARDALALALPALRQGPERRAAHARRARRRPALVGARRAPRPAVGGSGEMVLVAGVRWA